MHDSCLRIIWRISILFICLDFLYFWRISPNLYCIQNNKRSPLKLNSMNEHGFIDVKQPIGAQNDYRTSTYRGHLRLNEQTLPRAGVTTTHIFGNFSQNVGEEQVRHSEHKEQFQWKETEPYTVRNPPIEDVKYIKPFKEIKFRSPPRPIGPFSSVFRQDYQCKFKAFEEKSPQLFMQTAVEPTRNLLINRAKPGYGQLLDPSATTNNLTYMAYTPQELTISTSDNITFWNWKNQKFNIFKTKEIMCNMFRAKEYPKRRGEYQNVAKHVPNSGLTTETRSNFVKHLNELSFDIPHIRHRLGNYSESPMIWDTENKIYGSRTSIQRYIK